MCHTTHLSSPQNIAAGRMGLAMCEKDMRVYDECTRGVLTKGA